MSILGLLVFAVGAIITLFGWIWLLVEAFKQGILWGLLCLCFQVVALVFVIVHWEKAKRPAAWVLLGWVLMFVGQVLSPRVRQGFRTEVRASYA